MESRITIGQLAQKHNISARAIRHYEKMGLLQSSRDEESNYRIYSDAESERLYQILLFKGMGFTLKEISSIITSVGKKDTIINIIKNRLKSLEKKAFIFNSCIAILNEFLEICVKQDNENIDSIQLLNSLITNRDFSLKSTNDVQDLSGQSVYILEDKDLDVLNTVRSEDFHALYMPFILGREDADILENFFINHKRHWGFSSVLLSDGTSLDRIYNSESLPDTIRRKIAEAVLNAESSMYDPVITYKDVVIGLCDIFAELDCCADDSIEAIEIELIAAIFNRAIEIIEFSGRLDTDMVESIARLIEMDVFEYTGISLKNAIKKLSVDKGYAVFKLARIVNNAVKRNIMDGLFHAMSDCEAMESQNWLLDRALDMAVRYIRTREIEIIGNPYKILFPVIFQIAYMRTRMLYAATNFIIPEIKVIKEKKIIGAELETTDRDGACYVQIQEFENNYYDRFLAGLIPNRADPDTRYGVFCRYRDEFYSYITDEEVTSLENVPEGMTGEVIPEGAYAVFSIKGGPLPYRIIETFSYAHKTWLPASDYKYQFRPQLLIYNNEHIGRAGNMDSTIMVCIPVEPKEA